MFERHFMIRSFERPTEWIHPVAVNALTRKTPRRVGRKNNRPFRVGLWRWPAEKKPSLRHCRKKKKNERTRFGDARPSYFYRKFIRRWFAYDGGGGSLGRFLCNKLAIAGSGADPGPRRRSVGCRDPET